MKCGKRIVLFTLFAMNLVEQPAPEVEIAQGILSGIVSADGSILEYIGIPYATTTSESRFKAPLPAPSWDGVYKATKEYECPSPSPVLGGISGVEDCLKINVYVPALAIRPVPVMVFVHGGAFYLGSGGKLMYGPEFLVKHDVILVTFNYRLGVLGFTCLNIPEAPGNAGLKDQVAALRWVKKNIAAFGGDPDNITVFGQSAGGTSTSMLLASETTTGLFNKAIVQSGSSIASWAINRDPVWVASLIAKELGYNTTDPRELYQIFAKLPYQELVAARPKKPLGKFLDTELLHLPCIEKTFNGEEAIINDLPYNIINRKPKNIPVMYGSTSKEGLFLIGINAEDYLSDVETKYVFASDLKFPSNEEAGKVDKRARRQYFGEDKMNMNNLMNISEMMTDLYFEKPVILESAIMINKNNAPVFNYYFDYSGGRNFLKYLSGYQNESGACHGDELLYLFNARLWLVPINSQDRKIIENITRFWTNFAKYGDPTPPSDKDTPVRWIPSTKENFNFLYIRDQLKMGPLPNPETYRLWKDIYDKYRDTGSETPLIAPLPPPSWSGTFKAVDEHYQCPQAIHPNLGIIGMEDCLKINVYVPAHASNPLPVMVYIHGGSFILGNGGKLVYNPEFLVKHGVIVVTFNYRIGMLGFLCLGIKEAPGNAGLKDQVAALRWVQKNIAAFGGDPDNVTLFGHSAGSVTASVLLASNITDGLFHRVIMQSGSALSFFSSGEPGVVAAATAKHFGYDTEDPKELYQILSKIPLDELIKLPSSMPILHAVNKNLIPYPCVEKNIPGEEAIITDIPYYKLITNPKNLPVIHGITNKEGLYLRAEETDELLKEFNEKLHTFSDLQFSSEKEAKAVQNKIKKYYFGDKDVNKKTIMNATNFYGDIYFEFGCILESEILVNKTNTPVYNYYFKYDGGRNMVKSIYKVLDEGASHGDDILYIFSAYIWPYKIKTEDQKIIDWMTKMWTNFAKFGDPTPSSDNDLPLKWKPSSKESLNFLYIDSELKMGPMPNPQRYQFWKNIYTKYRKNCKNE